MSTDLHYRSIDWANITHQRIVAASLVQGAYNLESERQEKMHGMEKAQELGKRLGFEIYRLLVDETDGSYFGTIFKYKYEHPNLVTIPPKYVIAFRGTCLDPETVENDLHLDLKFIIHKLHESKRCEHALNIVEDIVSIEGPGNVWLTGHSLGSAIALIIGRKLVTEKEFHVKTFLFNPPFVSFSAYWPFRNIYWLGRSVVTGVLDMVVHYPQSTISGKRREAFKKLRPWAPYLFVNKKDHISNGYICYFKQRKFMSIFGASGLEDRATQNSLVSLIGDVFCKEFEPVHLIPSANLTRTKGSIWHPTKSHGIKQWWQWHHGDKFKIKTKSYVINGKLW